MHAHWCYTLGDVWSALTEGAVRRYGGAGQAHAGRQDTQDHVCQETRDRGWLSTHDTRRMPGATVGERKRRQESKEMKEPAPSLTLVLFGSGRRPSFRSGHAAIVQSPSSMLAASDATRNTFRLCLRNPRNPYFRALLVAAVRQTPAGASRSMMHIASSFTRYRFLPGVGRGEVAGCTESPPSDTWHDEWRSAISREIA